MDSISDISRFDFRIRHVCQIRGISACEIGEISKKSDKSIWESEEPTAEPRKKEFFSDLKVDLVMDEGKILNRPDT